MESIDTDALKHDIKACLLKHEEMSRVMSNAAITVVGNLALEERKLVKRIKDKRERYENVLKEYGDIEYMLQQEMNDPSSKQKKIEALSKKMDDLRKHRVALWDEIKEFECTLSHVRLSQQGGDELESILRNEYEAVCRELQEFKENHPFLVTAVAREIETFMALRPGRT